MDKENVQDLEKNEDDEETASTPGVKPGETVSPSRYEAIANLDEVEGESEKWADRTSIITKYDHESYEKYAKEFVEELVASVKTPPAKLEKQENHSEAR